MKFLIIPDVHNRYSEAEELIEHFPEHQAVFLGDYFDSFGDNPAVAGKTAEWLRYSIGKGRIHLMGNHDLPYRWQDQQCPGYTREKHRAILQHMRPDDWNQIRLALILSGSQSHRPLVLSHAGFTLANLYGVPDFRDVGSGGRLSHLRERLPQEHLESIRVYSFKCAKAGDARIDHFWFNQGDRMGELEPGGPFWIDRHSLHSQLPGIDQIVGHSFVATPQRHCDPHESKPESVVWFIDGHGDYAALLDGSVTEQGGLTVTPIHARGEVIGKPWPE